MDRASTDVYELHGQMEKCGAWMRVGVQGPKWHGEAVRARGVARAYIHTLPHTH